MMVLLFAAGLAILAVAVLAFWSIVAEMAGGQYPTTPSAINEFLAR